MTRLTMYKMANYRIRIPGELPKDWLNWESRMELEVENVAGKPISTTISGKLDQAALMGLLRSLFNLGVPLISVECLDFSESVVK